MFCRSFVLRLCLNSNKLRLNFVSFLIQASEAVLDLFGRAILVLTPFPAILSITFAATRFGGLVLSFTLSGARALGRFRFDLQAKHFSRSSFSHGEIDFQVTRYSDQIAFVVCVFDNNRVLLASKKLADLLQQCVVLRRVRRETTDLSIERCLAVNST